MLVRAVRVFTFYRASVHLRNSSCSFASGGAGNVVAGSLRATPIGTTFDGVYPRSREERHPAVNDTIHAVALATRSSYSAGLASMMVRASSIWLPQAPSHFPLTPRPLEKPFVLLDSGDDLASSSPHDPDTLGTE
jgi:hypothetical protein